MLQKLTATSSGQRWEPRYVQLTRTHVLVFKSRDPPAAGARCKTAAALARGATVEAVGEGEVDEPRAFSFSVVPGAPAPGESERDVSETVLACASAEQFEAWTRAIRAQCEALARGGSDKAARAAIGTAVAHAKGKQLL